MFFVILIVDTIGTVDDLIENYEFQLQKLEILGLNIYKKKIEEDYVEKTISSLKVKYGISIPATKRISGKYKLYASNGVADYINQYNAENSIIFGCRGSVGNVYYSKEKSFVLNTAFYIESPNEYGNLYFSLVYENGLTLYATGAAQPQITINAISNVNLKFPVDNELNSILDLMSKIENKIDILKQEKKLLLSKYFS